MKEEERDVDLSILLAVLEGSPQSVFYQGLSNEQLQNLEKRLGVTLPNTFKSFLKSTNGGEFYQEITVFGNIDSFDRQQESLDLIKRQLQGLPPNLLPFSQGLDYYCFDLSGPKEGEYPVVSWSSQMPEPVKVAGSFVEWLEKEVIDKNEFGFNSPQETP